MKRGDIISTTEYMKVLKIGSNAGRPAILAENLETGEQIGIASSIANEYNSADSATTTEKVSMTAAVGILENVGDKAFTVTYTKKPDAVEVAKAINKLTAADRKKKTKVEKCMLGEERVMRGRLIDMEPKLGRSQVVDLDITKKPGASYDNRLRQVDHRTIKSLIVDNVKYTVK